MEKKKDFYPTYYLRVGTFDVYLIDLEEGHGKIFVDNGETSYSYYWGAMGSKISEFLQRTNEDYFSMNLVSGNRNCWVFDARQTFKEIRRFLREDLGLKWYEHQEFHKDFRAKLKKFQERCEEVGDSNYFVSQFHFEFDINPDFYLIKDKWKRESIEADFKSISEPWDFIQTKRSEEYKKLCALHKELVKVLKTSPEMKKLSIFCHKENTMGCKSECSSWCGKNICTRQLT